MGGTILTTGDVNAYLYLALIFKENHRTFFLQRKYKIKNYEKNPVVFYLYNILKNSSLLYSAEPDSGVSFMSSTLVSTVTFSAPTGNVNV